MLNKEYKYICYDCDYKTNVSCNFNKHNKTQKHISKVTGIIPIKNVNKSDIKEKKIHECKLCNYKTICKSDYNKHIKTIRHINAQKQEHKETVEKLVDNLSEESSKELLKEALFNNNKNVGTITTNNSNNTINNTNNILINLVLDKNCPNAINFQEFIQGITVTVNDLLTTTQKGYVEGISDIVKEKLNELEPNMRPFHCSNKNKLEFYVKNDDKWEKDKNKKVNKGISSISRKHGILIKTWQEQNPGWENTDNGLELFHKMVQNVLGGSTDEAIDKNNNAVLKEICGDVSIKEVI